MADYKVGDRVRLLVQIEDFGDKGDIVIIRKITPDFSHAGMPFSVSQADSADNERFGVGKYEIEKEAP